MFGPLDHATFLPADPHRHGSLALWPDTSATRRIDLVLPRRDRPARRSVPARLVPLADVLDELAALRHDDDATRSVHAWAVVTRVAVGLVARGRLVPASTRAELDCWRLGPLDRADRDVRAALAAWLPPEAHATPIQGHAPPRITAPVTAVSGFYDAVADLLPRTASAAFVAGHWAFAERGATRSPELAGALPDQEFDRAVVGLRVHLPADEGDRFSIDLQVRSALDPSLVAEAADIWAGRAEGFGTDAETDLLVAIRRGAQVWPPLQRLLAESTPSHLEIDDEDGIELLGSAGPLLSAVGIEVLAPAVRARAVRAVAHVEPPPGTGDAPSHFDFSTLCELTYRPTLDGEPLSDAELAELAASRRPVVRLRGEWVVVDPAEMAKLARREQVSASDALAAALGGELHLDGELRPAEVGPDLRLLADRLRYASSPHELSEPPGLQTTLRPYQRRGLAWLAEMTDLGVGGVLADDMGLGKTVQLIALHLLRSVEPDARATLVVCPASVVGNWQHELARFAPEVPVVRYHGPDRTLEGVRGDDTRVETPGGPPPVVVTTYGVARRDTDLLGDVGWGLVVADEAQRIKNPNTGAARALRRIPASARVAMTGTPVENRLTELWALLDWTTPGLLGQVETFRRELSLPIERDRDEEATRRLARLVAPFVLRRSKADPDVAPDLPPKIETDHPVVLTPEQAGLYRAVVDESLEQIHTAEGMARRGLVLKLLTALKQICNHPAHYLDQTGPLAGRSGKLEAFDDLIGAIVDAGDAALVFTQYVRMGDLLCAHLRAEGIGHRFLHGSLNLPTREAMVEEFQDGAFPVFVISLGAGGLGLNLTRANHVVHYDRWWNPAVENQASDRAWRIGQSRTVQIHRLICDGTVEERIARMLEAKSELAEAVVGIGESWLTELSDEDLATLVRLGDGA